MRQELEKICSKYTRNFGIDVRKDLNEYEIKLGEEGKKYAKQIANDIASSLGTQIAKIKVDYNSLNDIKCWIDVYPKGKVMDSKVKDKRDLQSLKGMFRWAMDYPMRFNEDGTIEVYKEDAEDFEEDCKDRRYKISRKGENKGYIVYLVDSKTKDANLGESRLKVGQIVHLDPSRNSSVDKELLSDKYRVDGFWYNSQLVKEDIHPKDIMDFGGIAITNLRTNKKYNVNRFQLMDSKAKDAVSLRKGDWFVKNYDVKNINPYYPVHIYKVVDDKFQERNGFSESLLAEDYLVDLFTFGRNKDKSGKIQKKGTETFGRKYLENITVFNSADEAFKWLNNRVAAMKSVLKMVNKDSLNSYMFTHKDTGKRYVVKAKNTQDAITKFYNAKTKDAKELSSSNIDDLDEQIKYYQKKHPEWKFSEIKKRNGHYYVEVKDSKVKDSQYIYLVDPKSQNEEIEKAKSLGMGIRKFGGLIEISGTGKQFAKLTGFNEAQLEEFSHRMMSAIRKVSDSKKSPSKDSKVKDDSVDEVQAYRNKLYNLENIRSEKELFKALSDADKIFNKAKVTLEGMKQQIDNLKKKYGSKKDIPEKDRKVYLVCSGLRELVGDIAYFFQFNLKGLLDDWSDRGIKFSENKNQKYLDLGSKIGSRFRDLCGKYFHVVYDSIKDDSKIDEIMGYFDWTELVDATLYGDFDDWLDVIEGDNKFDKAPYNTKSFYNSLKNAIRKEARNAKDSVKSPSKDSQRVKINSLKKGEHFKDPSYNNEECVVLEVREDGKYLIKSIPQNLTFTVTGEKSVLVDSKVKDSLKTKDMGRFVPMQKTERVIFEQKDQGTIANINSFVSNTNRYLQTKDFKIAYLLKDLYDDIIADYKADCKDFPENEVKNHKYYKMFREALRKIGNNKIEGIKTID